MKAFLLDVGNSRLKWGLLDNGVLRHTGHIAQSKLKDQGLSVLTSRLPRHVDSVFVCNVAGASLGIRLAAVLGLHCNCEVHFARSVAQACGVTNSYRQPRRLGVDRWVAMIAARAECDTSSIVVDAGTAVTIDVLDDDGQHLGGQILPGFELMSNALAKRTSDLPLVRKRLSGLGLDIFASNSTAAVSQGISGAIAGAVERAERILRQDGYDPTIFLTGGDAGNVLNALNDDALHRPNLVLEGLARILAG
jgi:type III pantothenate kinase